ncbi:tRNA pseudouridine(55) synthase TruB [Geminicoccaceae bacterium 1502E]|uniref:tRNA pseudouridine synthase B n=1 Tax=Marinimicrococcus flavescens TaxID=3031815 RepID=A0AAP3V046_9PROT|nr:tRNA pseudouridine(55) synthase TruB [Marinimicrococcus flavescens]MDX6749270.1 tRNA pseudouridine(55) synthase TruB [Geminicoccaceae bacterium 1502E]
MGRRSKGRPINGWLVVDKGVGITSTQVVNRVKWLTQAQKVGHGGTLDPLATGVLPIAMGEATKTVAYVMDARKGYRFTVRFGESRDTDDAEGEVLASSELRPSDEAIEAALAPFRGEIQQRPPIYAAVKIQGERAYDLARRGEKVELEPRPVRIDRLDFVRRVDADHAEFEMECGKGTYVRALARDLGEVLGCHAHVSKLRRTAVGGFTLEHAVSLNALEGVVQEDSLPQVLVSVATALAGIPALAVTEPQALRLRAGQPIRVSPGLFGGEQPSAGGTVLITQGGDVVAIGRFDDGEVSPLRVFNLKGGHAARA